MMDTESRQMGSLVLELGDGDRVGEDGFPGSRTG